MKFCLLLFAITLGLFTYNSKDDISPLKAEIYRRMDSLKGTVPQNRVDSLKVFVSKKIEEHDSAIPTKDSGLVYSKFR